MLRTVMGIAFGAGLAATLVGSLVVVQTVVGMLAMF